MWSMRFSVPQARLLALTVSITLFAATQGRFKDQASAALESAHRVGGRADVRNARDLEIQDEPRQRFKRLVSIRKGLHRDPIAAVRVAKSIERCQRDLCMKRRPCRHRNMDGLANIDHFTEAG